MPIALLQDNVARAITASLVLYDACSVIKELIDNALDAHATSISVEISANTLDVIQVKDNGIGIGVEDRQLLCKHGCTSKIRDIDDLAKLGGSSLGFRGEALASIADSSDNVSITTKVEGELVASQIKFGPAGRMLSSASASHPAGSTIRISNFLTTLPVRKQAALKSAGKTLAQIKKMLHRYAFARPIVRFTLKVLKGKDEKMNWSFAPCKNPTQLSEVATSVVGKDTATLCEQHSISSAHDGLQDFSSPYHMDGLLVTGFGNDQSKTTVNGQFISIDGRPVTAERGQIKKLVNLYKSYLQHAAKESHVISANPFLYLQIRCPPESYDVNVEPAKDEVLFYNPEHILSVAEKLFEKCYGIKQNNESGAITSRVEPTKKVHDFSLLLARKKVDNASAPASSGSDPMDSERSGPASQIDTATLSANSPRLSASSGIVVRSETISHTPEKIVLDVAPSESDNDAPETQASSTGSSERLIENIEGFPLSSIIMNPLTTPRMRARLQASQMPQTPQTEMRSPVQSTRRIRAPMNSSPVGHLGNGLEMAARRHVEADLQLLSPSESTESTSPYQNPGPPIRRRRNRVREVEDEGEEMVDNSNGVATASVTPYGQQALLENWSRRINRNSCSDDISDSEKMPFERRLLDDNDNMQANRPMQGEWNRTSSAGVPLSLPMQVKNNRPFKAPSKTSTAVKNVHSSGDSLLKQRMSISEAPSTVSQGNADLAQIMDFEHRKIALHKQQRQAMQGNPKSVKEATYQIRSPTESMNATCTSPAQSDLAESTESNESTNYAARFGVGPTESPTYSKSNPHRNRQVAAVRSLADQGILIQQSTTINPKVLTLNKTNQPSKHPEITTSAIPTSDPRGYLISTVKKSNSSTTSTSPSKISRTKSTRLPFETIPAKDDKHDIIAITKSPTPNINRLNTHFQKLRENDSYAGQGKNTFITWSSSNEREIEEWQTRIENLIRMLYQSDPNATPHKDSNPLFKNQQKSLSDGHIAQQDILTPMLHISLSQVIEDHVRNNVRPT